MVEDKQLIAQYAADGAEAAFAELVRRHLDLVYATALRQVNGDSHLAEDITQNVFADLARKSRELTRSTSIAGWLYTSARFAASKAVRSETRRRAREEAAVAMIDADSTPPNASNDLRSLLDDALGQLDEPDRDAVVLRYFETAEFSAVGAALGVSQNAARMRVERALEKLRAIIEKRGLTTTSAVVAATLSEWAGKAAPAGLAATIVRSAAIPAAGAGIALSPLARVFALAKSKLVAGAAVLGILAATAYMVPRTMFDNTGAGQTTRRPSASSAATKVVEQSSAFQMPRGDSHAFQRLLERHDARAQLEHAKHVQAAEAAWAKAQTQLTDWIHATNASGVTRFGASVRATVPFGQSLLTGGWNTEPGRRTVALMTIIQIDAAGNRVAPGTVSGQIVVEYQFASAPIAMLDKLGLQALNSPDNQSAISLQMPSEAELLVKRFEADSDTDVLSAPRVTTLDESAATVSTVNNEMVEGREQELGISASIQPIQVTADGSGMDVGITVRYAMRTPTGSAPSRPPGLNASSSGSNSDSP